MEFILAILAGTIVTIMNVFNGQLSNQVGVYLSTVIIHLVGLFTLIIIMIIKKQKISFQNHIPLILYTGGMIGVFTVLFNVMSISTIGAALVTALGLLGQMLTSLVLEYKGWLGAKKRTLTFQKVISLVIVMIGIGVMIL
ncbi:DMT family transporter [Longibaculum muris]|uniref:DMT family transporter n=1 Tax=Longibaculum muris TaxID=1796628 RepID=UPI0018A107A9|nr:DMT family transporter [Longibaculum muris]